MELSRAQKSAKNAVYSILLQLVMVISNFVTKTIFVKFLGLQYAGLSALFTDVLGILSIAEMGFGTAMGYALYLPLHKKDYTQIAKLMRQYRKIYGVVMAVIMAAGLVCVPLLKYIVKDVPDIQEDINIIFLLYVVKTAASYFLMYKTILLDANQQKSTVSKISIVSHLVQMVVTVVVLVLTKNYYLYMVSFIALILLTNIVVSRVANQMFPLEDIPETENLSKEEKKDFYKNVRALALYKVSGTLQRNLDSVIVSMFLGTATVGLVANYRMIAYRVDGLFGQIMEGMRASVGNLASADNKDRQYEVFRKSTFLAFAIGNTICVALFALLNPFVNIWLGSDYLLSIEVVALMVVDVYILTMTRAYENFRIANALFIQGKYRPVAMVIINIVASVLLARSYGLAGILFATVITRVSTHVWFDPWLCYRHVFKRPFLPYLGMKAVYFLVFVANSALVYLIGQYISTGSRYADFILLAALAFVLPNVTLVALFGRTAEFAGLKVTVRSLLKRK